MEELMNTHPNFYDWRHLEQCQEPMTAWSPRVDPESPMPFMPEEPIDIMKRGGHSHVPWIVGITDDEGAFKASALMHDMKSFREIESDFEKLGPMVFGFHDGQCEAPKIHSNQVKLREIGNQSKSYVHNFQPLPFLIFRSKITIGEKKSTQMIFKDSSMLFRTHPTHIPLTQLPNYMP